MSLVEHEKPSEGEEEPARQPTHGELIQMLCDLGTTLSFYSHTEDSDGLYRHDVTWRDFEGHSPVKVFEVEMSGNLDHALASLSHASDTWRPDQLYLIISDEKDRSRVDNLVGPRVRGAFSRIAGRLRVLTWVDVRSLHQGVMSQKDLISDLARR